MPGKFPERLKKYVALLLLLLTVIIAVSVTWNINLYYNSAIENARIDARSSYQKDLLYRQWISLKGGVYVFPSDSTPPNPYLQHLSNRDIVTTTGKKLTLINPAYMTRQVHELGHGNYKTQGHITSLLPLNPHNKPDAWETESLRSFEKGAKEAVALTVENGIKYLRFMRPMITENSCLKCHAHQGYKAGDIRGGIAVKVPLESYLSTANSNIAQMVMLHLFLLMAGFVSVGVGARVVGKSMAERDRKAEELRKSREILSASEHKYRNLIEQISDVIWIMDVETFKYTYMSPSVMTLSGYTPEEVRAAGMKAFLVEESYYRIRKELPARIAGFRSGSELYYYDEIQLYHKDGSIIWSETISHFVVNEISGHLEIYGVARNINERKLAEVKTAEHIKEIEKFNRIATAREMRIAELKQRINTLLKESGKDAQFRNSFDTDEAEPEKSSAAQAIPVPDKLRPEDLFDRNLMQVLVDEFSAAFGVTAAIINLDGTFFASSGWINICAGFHRKFAPLQQRCIESDTMLARELEIGEKFTVYKCRNGLIDAAAPIIVNGQHITNLFIGQFLTEPPDRDYFRKQAKEFGLNEAEYLEALDSVPYLSKEKLKPIMKFLAGTAELIGRMGLERIRSKEAETNLEIQTVELRNTISMLKEQRLAAFNLAEDAHEARIAAESAQESLKKSQGQLKRSLEEKETLIRELYHRTKNNMQIIISMLNLEAAVNNNEELNKILNETSSRIVTMALVHQKLYQAQDLSSINFREYITELTGLLSDTYQVNRGKIDIKLELDDTFLLIDYAVPCGLVINEIVSNTFKYAFPGQMRGELSIKMFRDPQGRVVMRFRDNGIGLPAGFDLNNSHTLGMQLVNTIINHQLGGRLEIASEGGVKIEITFSDDQYEERV